MAARIRASLYISHISEIFPFLRWKIRISSLRNFLNGLDLEGSSVFGNSVLYRCR